MLKNSHKMCRCTWSSEKNYIFYRSPAKVWKKLLNSATCVREITYRVRMYKKVLDCCSKPNRKSVILTLILVVFRRYQWCDRIVRLGLYKLETWAMLNCKDFTFFFNLRKCWKKKWFGGCGSEETGDALNQSICIIPDQPFLSSLQKWLGPGLPGYSGTAQILKTPIK